MGEIIEKREVLVRVSNVEVFCHNKYVIKVYFSILEVYQGILIIV